MENKRDTGGKRLIVVSSVTYALKSRDLLFQRGIKAYIERLPRTRESGCRAPEKAAAAMVYMFRSARTKRSAFCGMQA